MLKFMVRAFVGVLKYLHHIHILRLRDPVKVNVMGFQVRFSVKLTKSTSEANAVGILDNVIIGN